MPLKTILSIILINFKHFWFKATKQHKKIIPYKFLVELTNRCNSKCLTCDIWKIPQEKLISLDIEKFDLFTKSMGKHLKWLAFSGGEVSLVSNFKEFIQVLKLNSIGLKIITFTTNGLNPDRILENAQLLKKELNCTVFITISLDGNPEIHDKIRGVSGNYLKAKKTFDLLTKARVWCHFGITISNENADFLIENAKEVLITTRAITISHEGGLFLNQNLVNKENDKKIIKALKEINKQYRIKSLGEILVKMYLKIGIRFLESKRAKNVIPCDVGNSSIHLHADGSMSPCMYLPAFTTIDKKFSINEFSNPKAIELKERAQKGNCPKCWMNCYAPHNIMQSPIKSLVNSFFGN
jgi:MoaA/NifB/PqqE/SkfB family radical SAM enzyme